MKLSDYLEKLDKRFETIEPSSIKKEENIKRRGSTRRKFGFSSLESKKHPIQKTVSGADE
jgi:hypothetical protein